MASGCSFQKEIVGLIGSRQSGNRIHGSISSEGAIVSLIGIQSLRGSCLDYPHVGGFDLTTPTISRPHFNCRG